jgi:hypothetical protein
MVKDDPLRTSFASIGRLLIVQPRVLVAGDHRRIEPCRRAHRWQDCLAAGSIGHRPCPRSGYGYTTAFWLLVSQAVSTCSRRPTPCVPEKTTSGALVRSGCVATGFLWAPCAGPVPGLIVTGAALEGASVPPSEPDHPPDCVCNFGGILVPTIETPFCLERANTGPFVGMDVETATGAAASKLMTRVRFPSPAPMFSMGYLLTG